MEKLLIEIIERLILIEEHLVKLSIVHENKPLTLNEAANYTNLSRSYLYKMTSKNEIPHYKPGGKRLYFSKTELDKWLLSNSL